MLAVPKVGQVWNVDRPNGIQIRFTIVRIEGAHVHGVTPAGKPVRFLRKVLEKGQRRAHELGTRIEQKLDLNRVRFAAVPRMPKRVKAPRGLPKVSPEDVEALRLQRTGLSLEALSERLGVPRKSLARRLSLARAAEEEARYALYR
jgi:hypothetical protein